MKVRDRIAHQIRVAENDIRFYTECGPDYADKVEQLEAYKKRLEDRAGHYDREVLEGYERPASLRNGISSAGEMSGQSIDLD